MTRCWRRCVGSGWEDRRRAVTTTPFDVPPAVPVAPHARYVEREDIAQTHVVLGSAGIARYGDPRRYAVALLGTMLGGGMSSRLFQRVREEMGTRVLGLIRSQLRTRIPGITACISRRRRRRRSRPRRGTRGAAPRWRPRAVTDETWRRQGGSFAGRLVLSLERSSSRMYRAAATELYGEPYRPIDDVLALDRCDRCRNRARRGARVFRSRTRQTLSVSVPRPFASRPDGSHHIRSELTTMRIGVPKEIKTNENRIALVPAGAEALVAAGTPGVHREGRRYRERLRRQDYTAVGATIVPDAATAWGNAELLHQGEGADRVGMEVSCAAASRSSRICTLRPTRS
jgi:hypothetical protein